jgi:hypothetical protein
MHRRFSVFKKKANFSPKIGENRRNLLHIETLNPSGAKLSGPIFLTLLPFRTGLPDFS